MPCVRSKSPGSRNPESPTFHLTDPSMEADIQKSSSQTKLSLHSHPNMKKASGAPHSQALCQTTRYTVYSIHIGTLHVVRSFVTQMSSRVRHPGLPTFVFLCVSCVSAEGAQASGLQRAPQHGVHARSKWVPTYIIGAPANPRLRYQYLIRRTHQGSPTAFSAPMRFLRINHVCNTDARLRPC